MEPIWTRPETAGRGRPAIRSRAGVAAAAVALADAEGLAAVTMRGVAAALGTGPASLYRYVRTRDELVDLMVDAVTAEYRLAPAADWLGGMLDVARQTRAIMRRHPWAATAMPLRPTPGPHALDLIEHVLETLAAHPAPSAVKLRAFAVLTGVVAMITHDELAAGPSAAERQAQLTGYLLAAGRRHPRIAAALAEPAPGDAADPFDTIVTGVVSGLLTRRNDPGT